MLTYKQGFPADTDREEARDAALAGAADACTADGYTLGELQSVEYIETPEHVAAGEYLVKVVAAREPA